MGKRRQKHEDHANHEAWAIPYGDLVTLLLAFFVVMYAISSVNEGKYRAVSDALSSAFGGTPRTITPIQLGATQLRGSSFDRPSLQTAAARSGPASSTPVKDMRARQLLDMPSFGRSPSTTTADREAAAAAAAAAEPQMASARRTTAQLQSLGRRIQDALSELVRQKLVTVRRGTNFLEVEIQSDILFASGVALPSPLATSTVQKLAAVLQAEPNSVRVEGYTDNVPIRTVQFPSNWELSAARAASVVHVLIDAGIAAERLAVVGFGSHQPVSDNATIEGRNANRRVLLVILANPQGPDAILDAVPTAIAGVPRTQDPNTPGASASTTANPAPAVPLSGTRARSATAPTIPSSTATATPADGSAPLLPIIAATIPPNDPEAG